MIGKRALWAIASLFSIWFSAWPGMAQTGRGSVTGTVTDQQGRALQGALVKLDPGGATALTNSEGLYTVSGLPAPMKYKVSVTYAGFADTANEYDLKAGETDQMNFSLSVASNSENVQVYAGRQGGEIEAINRTFNADNVINVLPADVITSLPNANVADAIGRLPSVSVERDEGEAKYVQIRGTEPRLTHTTLDGVTIASPETVRQIKLDLIPADLVESVQINKTLLANQEGDGIGGSVDLRTKSAEARPTVALEGIGGYTPIIGGRAQWMVDGTVGKRFLSGGKLGALIGLTYDYNGRGINDVEPGPVLTGTYDLRDYFYYRDRRGMAGTLDYRFNDTSSIYLKGLYSHFNDFGEDSIYSPKIVTFVSALQGGNDGTLSFQQLLRRPVQDIGGLQLGGRSLLKQSLLAWDLDASVARTRDDGYSDAYFGPSSDANNPLNNIQYGINVKNPLIPVLQVQNGVNLYQPNNLFLNQIQRQYTYNPEVDLGFGASLLTPYTLGGHAGTFEFGGRFRNEHKFENQDTRNFYPTASNPEDPTLAQSNFLSAFSDPGYYGGNYGPYGPGVNFNKVSAFTAIADGGVAGGDILGNSFNQLEKVSAGYLMNTINLNRFRFIVGVRFEATSENNTGYDGAGNAGQTGTTQIRAKSSYIDVLPSASLRYALTPSSGIRIVYGRGLSRPDFQDLIPFTSAPSSGSAQVTETRGNPNLLAEYADDIDLLYDNNLSRVGLLQAGFFYKNLQNPIVQTLTQIPGPIFLTQSINAGSAYIYGFEVAFQQHLTYLPGPLNGIGISANYGYTASQATLPPYIDPSVLQPGQISGPNRGPGGSTPPLLRQAPNTFNFSPTYDKRGFSIRMGLEYNQANIAAYQYDAGANSGPIQVGGGGGGLHGPNGDQYFYSHLQVDLQASYKLPKGFSAVGYALNLNNEAFGFYYGDPMYPTQREFYKQSFGGGLRWSPTRER
jgi:TonB-dependent receptor